MDATDAFALACAAHAGFQITVTALVYPVLGTCSAQEWKAVHERHSRAITPLVALVYGALVATGAVLVRSGPSLTGWAALAVTAAALSVTATAAAPLHGRLGERDDVLVARLLVADRWRCAAAVAGAVFAVVAAAQR